jgi:hypothetical protein
MRACAARIRRLDVGARHIEQVPGQDRGSKALRGRPGQETRRTFPPFGYETPPGIGARPGLGLIVGQPRRNAPFLTHDHICIPYGGITRVAAPISEEIDVGAFMLINRAGRQAGRQAPADWASSLRQAGSGSQAHTGGQGRRAGRAGRLRAGRRARKAGFARQAHTGRQGRQAAGWQAGPQGRLRQAGPHPPASPGRRPGTGDRCTSRDGARTRKTSHGVRATVEPVRVSRRW